MATEPTALITFDPDDPAEVLGHLAELADRHEGWVNFEPEVAEEHVPTLPSGLSRVFGALGPAIPLCTWTPGDLRGDATGPETVGIQHAAGTKLRPLLEQQGHPIPSGWVTRSDHPKRGLVVEIPPAVGHWSVLRWLVAAGETVSSVPTTGRWVAALYPP